MQTPVVLPQQKMNPGKLFSFPFIQMSMGSLSQAVNCLCQFTNHMKAIRHNDRMRDNLFYRMGKRGAHVHTYLPDEPDTGQCLQKTLQRPRAFTAQQRQHPMLGGHNRFKLAMSLAPGNLIKVERLAVSYASFQ